MKICKHCQSEYEGTEYPHGGHDCDYAEAERGEKTQRKLAAAQRAAKPFAEFIADWDAFPPLGLDDVIYSRHADPKGPMRNVRVSDLRKLLRALGVEIPKRPNAVKLRKSQLQLRAPGDYQEAPMKPFKRDSQWYVKSNDVTYGPFESRAHARDFISDACLNGECAR